MTDREEALEAGGRDRGSRRETGARDLESRPPGSAEDLRTRLAGSPVPAVPLPSTGGRTVDLASLPGRTVVYLYPMMGKPGHDMPEDWHDVPGLVGCTPQACAFRDHQAELEALGAAVFGLSSQDPESQREAAERLHLPYELLSDEALALADALDLPTVELAAGRFVERLTLVLRDGAIEHVFHPVPEPARNAEDVIDWLRTRRNAP